MMALLKQVRAKICKDPTDSEFMKTNFPLSVKYLTKWKKNYGFSGKLELNEVRRIKTNLKHHDQLKGRLPSHPGKQMLACLMWEEECKRREQTKNTTSTTVAFLKKCDKDGTNFVVRAHQAPPQNPQNQEPPAQNPVQNPLVEAAVGQDEEIEVADQALGEITEQLLQMRISNPPPPPYASVTATAPSSSGEVQTRSGRVSKPPERYVETFPMVQVPNPHAQGTMLVHRPWTISEAQEAVKSVTKPDTDIEQTIADITQLQAGYHLNGTEMKQALMNIFGLKWGLIAFSFNATTEAGPMAHDRVLAHLQHANTGLFAQARLKFARTPNYAVVQQTQQKSTETVIEFTARMREVFKANSGLPENHDPDSAYQQQLKMAIVGGFQPPIREWLTKNYVALPTASPNDFMTHAVHAERVIREKKQKKASQILITEQGETYVIDTRRPGKRHVDRRDFNHQQERDRVEGLCYICHKKGHLARDCRSRRDGRGREKGENVIWRPKREPDDIA